MSVRTLNENDIPALDLPGRMLRWIANSERIGPKYLSVCVIEVAPGEKVRPAHSHPNGEELIYIIRGSGRVLVDGSVAPVKEGSAVLFPQGSVHMLQNTGNEDMKVVCCFAPPSDLSTYKFFEDVDFPD
ncbi:MAG: cupin domain-containing protein [bacterium]|jgi:quercetin dioxygenase-like cupin family protein